MAPTPPARWSSLLWLGAILALVAAATMVPWRGECGFLAVLGAPCPGCGMTRSVVALLGGDVAASLRWHPLGLPLAAAAAAAGAMALHEGFTGRPTLRRAADRWGVRAAVAGLVLLGGVWAVRVLWRPEWSPDPIRPGSVAARVIGTGE